MNCKFSIFNQLHAASLRARANRSASERRNGFTLMELLIVISIIVILMLIAIPTANTIRKHTNEVSAQKSLQTIEQAESMYATNYPVQGYACGLQALSGEPGTPPSPTSAQLLTGQLATGFKDGYIFTITNCTKATANNTERITSYSVTAVPATVGKTGDRGFCVDEGGPIKADPAGGTNCTQTVQ